MPTTLTLSSNGVIPSGQNIQYDVMPNATEDWSGKIIQYVGETAQDGSYIKGGWYRCVDLGYDPGIDENLFEWKPLEKVEQELTYLPTISRLDDLYFQYIQRYKGVIYKYTGETGAYQVNTYTHNMHYYLSDKLYNNAYPWKQVELQHAIMPIANVYQNEVIQYIGNDGEFISGHWYKSVENNVGEHQWADITLGTIAQSTGSRSDIVMSQKATTDALSQKLNTSRITQTTGNSTNSVMSQKATTTELDKKVAKISTNVGEDRVYASSSGVQTGLTIQELAQKLNPYITNVQFVNLPSPSSTTVGKIVQYVGETTGDLINGGWYQCIRLEDDPVFGAVYVWKPFVFERESDSLPVMRHEDAGFLPVLEGVVFKYTGPDGGGNEYQTFSTGMHYYLGEDLYGNIYPWKQVELQHKTMPAADIYPSAVIQYIGGGNPYFVTGHWYQARETETGDFNWFDVTASADKEFLVRYTTKEYPHLFEFNELSWKDIANISKTSDPSLYWKVGDYKQVSLAIEAPESFTYSILLEIGSATITDRAKFLEETGITSDGTYEIYITEGEIVYALINNKEHTLYDWGQYYGITFENVINATQSGEVTILGLSYTISLPITIIGFNHDTVSDPSTYGKQKAGITLMLGTPRTIRHGASNVVGLSPDLLAASEWKRFLGNIVFVRAYNEIKCTVTITGNTPRKPSGVYNFYKDYEFPWWTITAPDGTEDETDDLSPYGISAVEEISEGESAMFSLLIGTIEDAMSNDESFHTPNFVRYDVDTDTLISSFWETSNLRALLNSSAFLSKLNTLLGATAYAEFAPVAVEKYTANCWSAAQFYAAPNITSDNIFLLSENEVFGEQRFCSHDYDYPIKYMSEPLLYKISTGSDYASTVLESCVSIDWKKLQRFIFNTRFHPTISPNRSIYSKLLSEPFLWVVKWSNSAKTKKYYSIYAGGVSAAGNSIFPNGQGMTAEELARYGITDLGENTTTAGASYWVSFDNNKRYAIRIKLPYLNYSVAPAIEEEQYQLFKDGSSKFFWSSRYLEPTLPDGWKRKAESYITSLLLLRSTDNQVQGGSSPNNAVLFNGAEGASAEYNSSQAYSKGDTVWVSSQSYRLFYSCIKAASAGIPVTNTEYWAEITSVNYALQNATVIQQAAFDNRLGDKPYCEPINMDILPCFCL